MRPIIMIFFALIFFIYSIFMLMVVTAYRDRKHAKFLAKVEDYKKTYKGWIEHQLEALEQKNPIDDLDLIRVNQLMDDPVFLRVLDETLINFSDSREKQILVMHYMLQFKEHVLNNMHKHNMREDIKHVYSVFRLGVYRIDDPEINRYLLEAIDTNSLYLKHNALRSMANIGNVDTFIEALRHLSWTHSVLNHKVVQDIINGFSGNQFVLRHRLVEEIKGFDEGIKRIVIDALRLKKHPGACDVLYELLQKPHTDMEVKMAIIRYFGVVRYGRVMPTLIDYMYHEQWEYRVASASALAKYKSEASLEALLECIGDRNWYVRFNTAKTLLAYDIGETHISEILDGDDRYAADVMTYALSLK